MFTLRYSQEARAPSQIFEASERQNEIVHQCIDVAWRGENTHDGALYFYPIFILLLEAKVSGVSVQDMLLRQPFLTPET